MPAFREATAGLTLGYLEKLSLGLKLSGTLLKLGYAFVFQETVVAGADYLFNDNVNRLGGIAMPAVNALANALTGYDHADADGQASINVYPGDLACRVGKSPHAKWQEESGLGLVDLMFLLDDVGADGGTVGHGPWRHAENFRHHSACFIRDSSYKMYRAASNQWLYGPRLGITGFVPGTHCSPIYGLAGPCARARSHRTTAHPLCNCHPSN